MPIVPDAAVFASGILDYALQDFVDRYEGRYRDIQLPLPIRLV
jgi:hypothetical protein